MPQLQSAPLVEIPTEELLAFGQKWIENGECLSRSPPYSSMQLGSLIDKRVARSLAIMLGNIPITIPRSTSLIAEQSNCVELGNFRVVGGVRPQNFDVGYRPDGVRIAFDSKTLNDSESVQKNYQNLINDLGTEATTVHTRFPYAVVAFIVAIPKPCLASPQKEALTRTLERLALRDSPLDITHKAEAISLVIWNPETGEIDNTWPSLDSCLRIEEFSNQIETAYVQRYKGLPPHD